MDGSDQAERLLSYIDAYWAEQYTSPSVREIAAHLGCSVSNAHYHLGHLVRKGLLERIDVSDRRVLYRRVVSVA